jgi:putative ABC transport system substrate-binding protein
VPRIGYLSLGPREAYANIVDAFLGSLRDLGYVEGQTIAIEWRFTRSGNDSASAELAELAAELVRLPVDVIVSISSTPASQAAKAATSTIPIVVAASDPVETGLVASLARPGGNVTGVSSAVGLDTKRLDLLRSVVTGLTRAAALADATNPVNALLWDEFRQAAEQVEVQAQRIDLYSTSDLERGFDVAESGGAQALSVIAQALLLPVRKRVAELALQHRVPSIAVSGEWAEAGLLMTYGSADSLVIRRHAAVYVDKILRGAKPADLPVEQYTVFDFVVNMTTAQALGLTIPSDLATQVTKWVE